MAGTAKRGAVKKPPPKKATTSGADKKKRKALKRRKAALSVPEGKNGGKLTKAGMGRPPGKQNAVTVLLKDAVLRAAELSGKKIDPKNKQHSDLVKYLSWLALDHPTAFTTLLGKILPLQIGGTADEGEGISIQINFTTPEVRELKPTFIDVTPSEVAPDG